MPTLTNPEEPPRPQPWHPARDTRPDPFEGRLFRNDLPAWLWAAWMPPMSQENEAMITRFKKHLRTLH